MKALKRTLTTGFIGMALVIGAVTPAGAVTVAVNNPEGEPFLQEDYEDYTGYPYGETDTQE